MALTAACTQAAWAQEIWRFSKTASLGRHPTKALETPKVIRAPMGKAIAFNGINEALFVGKCQSEAGVDQVVRLVGSTYTAADATAA